MQTVRDETGTRYLLLKKSAESSLVRDPDTGERRQLPNDRLETIDGDPPLVTAATAVPESLRTLLTAVHDEHSLGLVIELVDRESMAVRELLEATSLCESDLHGLVAELVAAGLFRETTIAGERAYEATDVAREAIEQARTTDGRAD
jgi:hypothetical protein